ncbi:hypothetical protein Tco_1461751 [Tanacetum coccineum]
MRLLLLLSSYDLCLCQRCRLVPSCFVIYDLELLSLSCDFVFSSEIFKSLSFRLDRLCHLAILCLDQHAHTLHHLESLLTISLDRLDIFEGRSCISEFIEHEHVVMNPTSAGIRHHHLHLYIQRISLTGFPAQSVGSSNTDVLDLPCLLVLITGTSQSRQHLLEQIPNLIFEADECDAFDSDVDEVPTLQTMFMASLTTEDPIYDEAGPSYDSNNPFEVQDHDTFVDHMDEYHEVHEMQNDVQHNYVVDPDADYTSDSNIIPYDQYVEDNEEHVIQCTATCSSSSVRNDALMSILDEMHEHDVQSRLTNKPDMVMNDSVTSELARYKELVGEYKKRAKFELTDRERKIDEQMRIIISDRNRKETSLKSELHSAHLVFVQNFVPIASRILLDIRKRLGHPVYFTV